jgi:protein-S-isoprenylcysteine O-methyltransferase
MSPQQMREALLESAWLTAQIAAGLAIALALAAALVVHLRAPKAPVRARRPGTVPRLLAMLVAAGAGAAVAWLTRGQAAHALPDLAQGAVAAVAALVALLGGMLAAWAAATLGRNFAVAAVVREGGGLVTTGPFALVRHPYYLALGLLGAAAALAAGSLPGALVFVVLYAPAARSRARLEDQVLVAAFPIEWPGYASRTPAFLPHL